MKVGHASREVNEALIEAQRDILNKNSMLDARYICGDRKVATRFISKFLKYCRKKKPEQYLAELLQHQQARREKKEIPFSYSTGLKMEGGLLRLPRCPVDGQSKIRG